MAEVADQILFIGVVLALTRSSDWTGAIVASFRETVNDGSVAVGGAGNITPSSIVGVGPHLRNHAMDQSSLSAPADRHALNVSALVVLVSFAPSAAFLILTQAVNYVVTSPGVQHMLVGRGEARRGDDPGSARDTRRN